MRLELGKLRSGWSARAKPMVGALLDLVDPQECLECRLTLGRTDERPLMLCGACASALAECDLRCCRCGVRLPHPPPPHGACGPCRLRPPAWDGLVVLADYTGPVSAVVRAFKFRGMFFLGEQLGRALAVKLRAASVSADLVVAVPMPWWRRYRRGLDHTLVLAGEVAQRLELPLASVLVRRHGTPFVGLSAAGRARARPSFGLRPNTRVAGTVLLIDDVITTGSTLESCTRLLRRAGACRVVAATIARTPSPRERALQHDAVEPQ